MHLYLDDRYSLNSIKLHLNAMSNIRVFNFRNSKCNIEVYNIFKNFREKLQDPERLILPKISDKL